MNCTEEASQEKEVSMIIILFPRCWYLLVSKFFNIMDVLHTDAI